MFSEEHNNDIIEGIPIGHDRVRNIVDILPYFKAFLVDPPPVDTPAWIRTLLMPQLPLILASISLSRLVQSSRWEEYRRYSRHGHGLSIYLRRCHYYVREKSALYKT